MYCKYCGHELKDNEKVCSHCGKNTDIVDLSKYVHKTNPFSTASLVISLIALIGGLIFNIIVKDLVEDPNIKYSECMAYAILCFIIVTLFGTIGLICAFVGHKRVRTNKSEGHASAGAALSLIAIVITIIFLIVNIVELNSYHFVTVHS